MHNPVEEQADLSVLHIGAGRYSSTDRDHSTFTIWRELAKGFRTYTVLGRSNTAEGACIRESNLSVHLIASRTPREFEFFWSQRHAVHLAQEVKADVVVVQSPILGGWAGVAIQKRRNAGLLVEIHSDDFVGDATLGSKKWLVQLLTAPVIKRADRIRALSNRMAQQIREKYDGGVSPRLVVLPPRVDLLRFKAKSNWSSDGPLKIIMVGTVTPRKGQLRLLASLAKSQIPLEVWIVGDGPELESCRALAENFAHIFSVRFFGRVSHSRLSELLTAADVFVMNSRSEGTPRAIMEAMASALPIVTTDVGFCADMISDGVEGFVLGKDPGTEILKCLARLHQDPALRRQLGQAARHRAVKEYDAAALYGRYKKLIAETAK